MDTVVETRAYPISIVPAFPSKLWISGIINREQVLGKESSLSALRRL